MDATYSRSARSAQSLLALPVVVAAAAAVASAASSTASSAALSSSPSSASSSSSAAIVPSVFPDLGGSMLYRPGGIPTKDVLERLESEFRAVLHTEIPRAYKGRGGRYRQADTARKNVLTSRILPELRYGKLPSADDYKAITLGPYKELAQGAKAWLDSWANKNCPDVRKKSMISKELRQTVLQFAVTSGINYMSLLKFNLFPLHICLSSDIFGVKGERHALLRMS